MIGAMLGPYRILEKLGQGGMGEVYKALDTRLNRTVAIKVLPPAISDDLERRARFEHEAKTIAALSHPHICALYDVGREADTDFLVMEHLDGQTLAARLQKGAMPVGRALRLATQIADALSAAHRQGIVHRDLKPANVMLTRAGAKLLDFGLAKLKARPVAVPAATTTVTAAAEPRTAVGVLLGTMPYMAPEQLQGKEADARSDIFALGCVLYEMLTGNRAFDGDNPASVIAAILTGEPRLISARQPLATPTVDGLVRKCLAKDPDQRWQSAGDLADVLRWLSSGSSADEASKPHRPRFTRRIAPFAALAVVAIAIVSALWFTRPVATRSGVVRLSMDVRPAEQLNGGTVTLSGIAFTPGGSRTSLAWTPDGQGLVFVGRRNNVQQLYVRKLDGVEARALPNTEHAQVPAVSPDGQWIAFWADGSIKKVALGGGPVTDVVPEVGAPPVGLAWDTGGNLFFAADSSVIWQVSADGRRRAVTTLGKSEISHSLPSPLPGGRSLLYTVRRRAWSWGDEEIVAQTLTTGERKVLVRDAADARYVASGHLLFLRRGVLFAMPFDPERLQVMGKEVPVVDAVAQALTAGNTTDITGAGQFAVSPTGMLAWVPGALMPYLARVPVSVDRAGGVTVLPAPERSYGTALRLSPDRRRLLVTILDLNEVGLWAYDLERRSLIPLNRSGEVEWPIWSPDGRRTVFAWLKDGRRTLATQATDGASAPQILQTGEFYPASFTAGGDPLVAVRGVDGIVEVSATGNVRSLVETGHTEQGPELAPDGRWLAYESNVSGRPEIYVRGSTGGPPDAVSIDGGTNAAWNPNGRELFFLTPRTTAGKRQMMAVDFTPGSPPRIGQPHPLFEFASPDLSFSCEPVRCYDVAPDGQRFYTFQRHTPPPLGSVTHINIVLNWLDELKAKAPPQRQ